MTASDDLRFRINPGAPRSRSGPSSRRFASQVLKQVSRSGVKAANARGARSSSKFGRGQVAAGTAGRTLGVFARRVIIKSRFVVLKRAGANAVLTHLRYIEREGVTREGQRGQGYGPEADAADLKAFEERGRGDRHQFRFIVSVEDAEQLEDLRGYTRALMQRLSIDLETPLDWVAVDHWDTDNPHTHIVLRGRAGNGQDLLISPDYMAQGMRARASALATQWLGPRTELEIRQTLLREVDQQQMTSLDRGLLRQSVDHVVELKNPSAEERRQNLYRARLQRLEALQLAERVDANQWRLSARMEETLSALGERGDIVRAMHRALRGQSRELVMAQDLPTVPVTGCILAKGLSDELNDRAYVVVDGIDGRAHYLRLPSGADLSAWPVGGIVQMDPASGPRPIDRSIADNTHDGLYRPADHVIALRVEGVEEPEAVIARHVRRLEALRHSGIVSREVDGNWRVTADFPMRAQTHDAGIVRSASVNLRSPISTSQQSRALGATWLDSQLLGKGANVAFQGFGAEVRQAMLARADFLVEQGLATWRGSSVLFARDLLTTLRDREVSVAGKAIAEATGLVHRLVPEGGQVSGVYRCSSQLVSGRFAMLDDGTGFSLVPWRLVIEQRVGQTMTAIVRGASVSWTFGRQRDLRMGS